MAAISNIRLSAEKLNKKRWKLTVNYDANFSEFEVANFSFYDGFEIWEDDPSSDDQITLLVSQSQFKPSSTLVQRELVHEISSRELNTEIGAEEIYVKVKLWTEDINSHPVEEHSRVIEIAP
jgi:hypothetical protein